LKGAALFIAIFALAVLIVPMVALSFDTAGPSGTPVQVHMPAAGQSAASTQPDVPEAGPGPQQEFPITDMPGSEAEAEPAADSEVQSLSGMSYNGVLDFKVYNQSTGKVDTVSLRDYVRGAVAAEMPVTFHPEALKAQAVAAHTFALHNHYEQQESTDPALKGADFAADPQNMLVYITEEQAKAFYGEKGDEYWERICEAADSVLTYVLEYEDEPIVAAYHAISAGQTEDASNVWTGYAPYLQASESEGDLLAPDYETATVLPRDTVQNALWTAYPSAELSDDPSEWFTGLVRSSSGYVTELDVGGVELHGKDIRTLFDLRSHNMDIDYSAQSESFTFTVRGYGHGVGLSQYGADFLARQGYTFDEILRNYYTGVTLKKIALEDGAQV